jgi:hydroxymethylpyrimidine pyrophosphatase-like HAD family hydrolase
MSLSNEGDVPLVNHARGLLRRRVLYVSDLDGTLLGPDSCVSAQSAAMLNRAIAKGALFTVATARTPATVVGLLREVDMRLPAVVMTGAALFDFSDHSFSRVCLFTSGSVERILSLYRHYRVSTFVYTISTDRNLLDVYHIGPLNDFERSFMSDRCDTPGKTFHVPEDGESLLPASLDDTVLLFSVQPWEAARSLYGEICASGIPCTPLCYHDAFGPEWAELEIFGPQTSKAAAVEAIASDVCADRIVAFGDNVNDMPLLRLADSGVAVANAIPELREMADEVIGSNAEDSVPRFILNHLEI